LRTSDHHPRAEELPAVLDDPLTLILEAGRHSLKRRHGAPKIDTWLRHNHKNSAMMPLSAALGEVDAAVAMAQSALNFSMYCCVCGRF
jgi:hypothetical protein